MESGIIKVSFYDTETAEVVGVQNLAFEKTGDNEYLVQQYHEIPGYKIDYRTDINETLWNEGYKCKEITFAPAKAFGSRAGRNLQDLTDEQLDDLYEKHVGYRAIAGGDLRDNVIEVLSTWEIESGEKVEF